jgi:hypothetical protein
MSQRKKERKQQTKTLAQTDPMCKPNDNDDDDDDADEIPQTVQSRPYVSLYCRHRFSLLKSNKRWSTKDKRQEYPV